MICGEKLYRLFKRGSLFGILFQFYEIPQEAENKGEDFRSP